MKSFIKKSIFISMPLIVLLIVLEFLLQNIPNDYSYKKTYLDQHASEIETLILGSSHTYYGLNPIYFTSSTFNASHISQSYNYDLAIFKKKLFDFKNLKTVILPLSYFSLYGKLEEGSESWRVKNYVLYYGFDNFKSISAHSEVLSHEFKINVERMLSYYRYKNSAITCSKLGWGVRDEFLKQDDLNESGVSGALRHTQENLDNVDTKKIFTENLLIMQAFINECRTHHIKLIFITLPAYKSYREHLNSKQLNLTLQTAANFDKTNENVIYLNFLYDSRFISDDFQDADHLSAKGATKLSKIVNNIIVHP